MLVSAPTTAAPDTSHPVPPVPSKPYQFPAGQVFSKEDSTTFLTDEAAPADPQHQPSAAFRALQETMLTPAPGKDTKPYSIAQELVFGHGGTAAAPGVFKARGLACLCERGRAVSVTLRSIEKHAANPGVKFRRDDEAKFLTPYVPKPDRGGGDAGMPESEFEASAKPKGNWFSVWEHCQALDALIFGGDPRPHGLVVVCGSTNSAKSLIARGLVHNLLFRRQGQYRKSKEKYDLEFEAKAKAASAGGKPEPDDEWRERRPHLVTFEDPIEKYLFEPKAGRAATAIAREFGIDYTPREKGKDVGSLAQGFADALRQTPFVYYVGEVREVRDWKAVLKFAGTGHLVVTSAHAGSLLEMMTKILSAVDASTQAKRRLAAEKIRAVVHMRAFGPAPAEKDDNLLLPSVWRKREKGLAALTGTGFGSIVPHESVYAAPNCLRVDESCFGYHALFQYLVTRRAKAARPPEDQRRTLAQLAREQDL